MKALFIIITYFIAFGCYAQQKLVGTVILNEEALDGYTLLAPQLSTKTYLIDNCGRKLHEWDSKYTPGSETKMLSDGSILRAGKLFNGSIIKGGGGGIIELINWESEVIWSFTLNNDSIRQHHDFETLPNGNLLITAWEIRSYKECIAQGRNPANIQESGVWSEVIYEIEPTGDAGGNIVWKWDVFDHLIQDFDATRSHFGVVAENSDRINFNYPPKQTSNSWIHANSIDYNEKFDQILLGSRNFSEVWVIDHSTSIQEASGSTGGVYGKGGDLLYRWGNPTAHDMEGKKILFNQHNAHLIPDYLNFGSQLIVFNNQFINNSFSSVNIISNPQDENGLYPSIETQNYLWSYPSAGQETFFSGILSGAEMLENGNIILCVGTQGRILEVTSDGQIVWEYISPVNDLGLAGKDYPLPSEMENNQLFRAHKYSRDYLRKEIFISEILEGGRPSLNEICNTITSVPAINSQELIYVYPNPVSYLLNIEVKNEDVGKVEISIYDFSGILIYNDNFYNHQMSNNKSIDFNNFPEGAYYLEITMADKLIRKKLLKSNKF